MADVIVTQDPTNPGVNKLNGPPIVNGKVPLSSLSVTGANPNDVVTLQGGVWQPVAQAGVESASNLGAGNGVFSSKVGTDFQFKSLVAGSGITITPAATTLTIATSTTGVFTTQFTSADQTITAGGALTLAHSLGAAPNLIQIRIKNSSTDLEWDAGDQLIMPFAVPDAGQNYGAAVYSDATNVYVRFGNSAGVFVVLTKDAGVYGVIDATKWVFIVKAWA